MRHARTAEVLIQRGGDLCAQDVLGIAVCRKAAGTDDQKVSDLVFPDWMGAAEERGLLQVVWEVGIVRRDLGVLLAADVRG